MNGARYKELIAYQKSYDLVKRAYALTREFPKEEIYGVVSQIRRACVSIPSNIAEGYMRGTKEYVQFLKVALGSSAEVETLVNLSRDLGYCQGRESDPIIETNAEVSRLLITYINRLKS